MGLVSSNLLFLILRVLTSWGLPVNIVSRQELGRLVVHICNL